MKKLRWVIFLLTLGSLLAGCSKEKTVPITGNRLYYLNEDENQLVYEAYTQKAKTKEDLVKEYILALKLEPQNKNYKSALPDDVLIIGYNFSTDGVLQLSFNDAYLSTSGVSEVLMRAVIVKTFCQIDGIQYVEFYINGQPLVLNGGSVVNRMEEADFIDNVGDMISYTQSAVICLYFSGESSELLNESMRQVEYDGSILLEQVIVEQLIKGPIDSEAGLVPTIPFGTKLNKVTKNDGLCTVDLNSAFMTGETMVSGKLTIYSLVNTLVELPDIDKVQILIDGETVPFYKKIAIDVPLERNLNLIESEK